MTQGNGVEDATYCGPRCTSCRRPLSWRERIRCTRCISRMAKLTAARASYVVDHETGELVDESTERVDGATYRNGNAA